MKQVHPVFESILKVYMEKKKRGLHEVAEDLSKQIKKLQKLIEGK